MVGVLAIVMALQLVSANVTSQTIDESPHIAAGYSYVLTGDYRLNVEHPPLVKLLAGAALRALHPAFPLASDAWENADQWTVGRMFLYGSGNDPWRMISVARFPMILLSATLVFAVWAFARYSFGKAGGLIALSVAAFDPTVAAHGQLVTTDVPVALFMFLAVIALYFAMRKPSWKRYVLFGIVCGLALGSKYSAVLLLPICVILWIIGSVHQSLDPVRQRAPQWFTWKRGLSILGVTILIIYGIAILLYQGETMRVIDDPTVPTSLAPVSYTPGLSGALLKGLIENPFSQWFATNVPVPAYRFFRGMVSVEIHNSLGHDSYLMGDYRILGWWYYFPVAFAVKTPGATLVLLGIALVAGVLLWRLRWRSAHGMHRFLFLRGIGAVPLVTWFLLLPVLIYFGISMTSHINLGVRHLLPIYPFLFVFIGSLGAIRLRQFQRWFMGAVAGLLVVLIVSYAFVYPHTLSFFNAFSGGSHQGHRYLLDSNIDWGQDLFFLRDYMRDHDIDRVALSFFGTAHPGAYGVHWTSLPTDDDLAHVAFDGVAAISLTSLYAEERPFHWLEERTPTARAGYSILIYDLRPSAR